MIRSPACPAGLAGLVTNGLDRSSPRASAMPTASNRTKRALQEIAKVAKIATRLTTEVSKAVRQLENLQREVQRLKTTSGRTTGPARSTNRKSSTRTHTTTGHTERSPGHGETPSREASEFVYPKEPFNPPSPPEPSSTGNN